MKEVHDMQCQVCFSVFMISVYIFHERFTIEDFVELSRGSMDDKICSNADLWKKKSKTSGYTCKIHVKCLFKP